VQALRKPRPEYERRKNLNPKFATTAYEGLGLFGNGSIAQRSAGRSFATRKPATRRKLAQALRKPRPEYERRKNLNPKFATTAYEGLGLFGNGSIGGPQLHHAKARNSP